MKQIRILTLILVLSSFIMTSCDKDDDGYTPNNPPVQSTVVKVAGDSASVAAKLAEFRIVLGDPLNTTPNQLAGRREVNWDGVPPNFNHFNPFPLDFFNLTDPAGANGRKRGLQYLDNGTVFRIDSTDFSEIEPTYATQFEPFTRKRLVSPVATNISEVIFKVPGTTTAATVKGFGVIFSDVDNANSTYIEFFNGSKSLGVFAVPGAAGAGGYSFLGVHFPGESITRVKITAGTAALGAGVKDITNGGTNDIVVFDDFIYSEPIAQ